VGHQADLLVLDEQQLATFAQGEQYLMDSMVFASQHNIVKDVMVNGQWVIENFQHPLAEQIQEKFSALLTRLS